MAKWDRANCYGYAVGKNKWLNLSAWHAYWEQNQYIEDDAISRKEAVKYVLEELQFKQRLRLINPKEMVKGKEYVAMKFSLEDYHFCLRGKNGAWRHKRGGLRVTPISEAVVMSKVWNFGIVYDTRTYIFERY